MIFIDNDKVKVKKNRQKPVKGNEENQTNGIPYAEPQISIRGI